jgi:hypothetical protein
MTMIFSNSRYSTGPHGPWRSSGAHREKRSVHVMFALAVAVFTAGASLAPEACAASGFMELTISVKMDPRDGEQVSGRIVSADPVGKSNSPAGKGLPVNCPFGDGLYWEHTFRLGDQIPVVITWKVEREASRGILFWRGKGSRMSLVISADGTNVRCMCPDKNVTRTKGMHAVFVRDGKTTRELAFNGENRGIPGRLFFRKGEDRVSAYCNGNGECEFKIRCDWDRLRVQKDSIEMPKQARAKRVRK